jgi:phage host-nuclease inhibitor protein Gam
MDNQEFQEKVMGYLAQLAEDMTGLRQEMMDQGKEMTVLREDMTAEIAGLREDMTAEIAGLRGEMTAEIAGLRGEMTLEMSRLRQDVTAEIAGLREEMAMKMTSLRQEITGLRQDIKELAGRVKKIELQIENEISPKISALHDGYVQHTDQLKRIEDKVSRHEEFIIQRVK